MTTKHLVFFSIIIPCYNTGNTVLDTLESVKKQSYKNWEALVINDGSPDNLEALVLDYIKGDIRFKYFKKENGGLASSRNFGIRKAEGSFILPLDSDNKVRPEFLSWASEVIKQNQDVDVIYGDAQRFGEDNRRWSVGDFDKFRMLNWNYIDACALIKKDVFEKIGLYDDKMPHQGLEDWEMWLRCIKHNFNFYYLKEITFDYRVAQQSMIKGFDENMNNESKKYIINKFSDLYHSSLNELRVNNRNLLERKKKIEFNILFKIYKKLKSII